MRYAKTHKEETRQKLLESSRAIAKKEVSRPRGSMP